MRGHLLVLPGPELSADFFAGVQHAIHRSDVGRWPDPINAGIGRGIFGCSGGIHWLKKGDSGL